MISLRVSVPKDMRGSSLLKAHQWAKSNLARSNPDAGAQDYTIQSVGGTPLTLSDLTNDSYDEVLLIGSVKSNPSSRHLPKTTNYPATYPDYNYPSYTRRPTRVGNRVPELLAEDIEPAMVERLVAQRGYFGGLNLIVKLQNTSSRAEDYTSPKFAALLQNMANAESRVKSNPGKVLYTSLNNTNGGILNAGEATRAFFSQMGLGKVGSQSSMKIKNWARETRKYGLDDTLAFKNFMNEVLEPFLVVRSANLGLLRAIRLPENSEYLLEKINKKGNKYAVFEDTPIYKKLMTYLPVKAEDFYEGIDYAIVAHPYFAYSELAEVMTDKKLLDKILAVLEAAPQSFMKQGTARSDLKVRSNLRSSLSRLLKVGDQYLYDAMQQGQLKVLQESKGDNNQNLEIDALREMFSTDIANPDNFIKQLPAKSNKILLVNGLAGFPTTPPPYWPRPIAYSVMDVIAENLQKILLSVEEGGMKEALNTSLAQTLGIAPQRGLDKSKFDDAVEIKYIGNSGDPVDLKTDKFSLFHAYHYIGNKDVDALIKSNTPADIESFSSEVSSTNRSDPDNVANHEVYAKIIFSLGEAELTRQYRKSFKPEVETELMKLTEKVVPLMTLFAGVEDYSQNKYKYTVNEGERVLILELLRRSLEDLNKKSGTTNTAFAATPLVDNAELKRIVKEICEGTEAEELEVMSFLQFKDSYDKLKAVVQRTSSMSASDRSEIQIVIDRILANASPLYSEHINDTGPIKTSTTPDPNIRLSDEGRRHLLSLNQIANNGDLGLPYLNDEIREAMITPGFSLSLNDVKVKIQGLEKAYIDRIMDIFADVNDVTLGYGRRLEALGNPPFTFLTDNSTLRGNDLERRARRLNEYYIELEDDFHELELKLTVLEAKLDTEIQAQADRINIIPPTRDEDNNYLTTASTRDLKETQNMEQLRRATENIRNSIVQVLRISPNVNALNTAQAAADPDRVLTNTDNFILKNGKFWPTGYYEIIKTTLEAYQALAPIQRDINNIYDQFNMPDNIIEDAEDMVNNIQGLLDKMDVPDAGALSAASRIGSGVRSGKERGAQTVTNTANRVKRALDILR